MSYMYRPVAYTTLILCVIGIDPYDILINSVFYYLYLATLYDYDSQPANVYYVFSMMKTFVFGFEAQPRQYYDTLENRELLFDSGDALLPCCYRVLIMLAVVLVFQEIVVRFCKNPRFPACFSRVFTHIFNSRIALYTCVYTCFEPLLILYVSSLLKMQSSP